MNIRQKFIIDTVERYKKDNKDEYKEFCKMVKGRRKAIADERTAKLDGAKEIRSAASVPEKIFATLIYVLNGVDEPKFLGDTKEIKWFVKKYPEFLIPSQY
jgi:hypothetical protein